MSITRPPVEFDPQAKASYVTLAPSGIPPGGVASTVEVGDSIHVDLGADRTVLGIEVIGEGNWVNGLVALAMQGRLQVAPAAGTPEAVSEWFVLQQRKPGEEWADEMSLAAWSDPALRTEALAAFRSDGNDGPPGAVYRMVRRTEAVLGE